NDIVIQRSPVSAPHSYRFLPNAIVRWMQLTGLDYGTARDLYRLIFGLLLFYAIYKYARLYTNQVGGILAMVFVAAVYPVSFERYAGQLTDPMSHLSFALAFIFLGTGDFAYLLSTLVIGSLAKETVLAMTAFFVLFSRREKGYRWKASLLSLATLAAFFGVRFAVLHGGMSYLQVSGVPPDFIRSNWADSTWPPLFLLTACAFLPLLALGWKETPLLLKRQIFFLLPVLFLSGLAFSWLHETRNFMPTEALATKDVPGDPSDSAGLARVRLPLLRASGPHKVQHSLRRGPGHTVGDRTPTEHLLLSGVPGSAPWSQVMLRARRWEIVAFSVTCCSLAALAAFQRWPGLNPSSLYLDDQWAASLIKAGSPGIWWEIMPQIPLGFLLIIKALFHAGGRTD